MKTSMLDYCKVILKKVHFDQRLFHKELHKALRWLSHDEKEHLQQWIDKTFGSSARPLSLPRHYNSSLPHNSSLS